jgi:hypothetical protein
VRRAAATNGNSTAQALDEELPVELAEERC